MDAGASSAVEGGEKEVRTGGWLMVLIERIIRFSVRYRL